MAGIACGYFKSGRLCSCGLFCFLSLPQRFHCGAKTVPQRQGRKMRGRFQSKKKQKQKKTKRNISDHSCCRLENVCVDKTLAAASARIRSTHSQTLFLAAAKIFLDPNNETGRKMDEAPAPRPAPIWQCHPMWRDKRNTPTYILRTVSLDRKKE